ncbi:GNAT family N-acetyltransferase [Niabella sp. 3A5MI-3]|nr:GNAT family N-acetyltransferase [Niabella beijingensis]
MKYILETDQLIIRELAETDEEGMFLMDADPEVHRYLGRKPITTKQEASDAIRMIRRQYNDFGIGRWALVEKSSGTFIGWT